MAVKLELYRVFKEVAETGNISAAAKNLYISQSAVSQSVKQLETALQARLFARSPRGVTLTGEGQMLYQYVRNALGLLATGEDKLSQAQQLRKLSQSGELDADRALQIMCQPKANQMEKISLDYGELRRFFPRRYTPREIQAAILKLVEADYKRRQRAMER